MAFHTPNPALRAGERRNGQLRAAFFARLFRVLWRGFARGPGYVLRTVVRTGSASRVSAGCP